MTEQQYLRSVAEEVLSLLDDMATRHCNMAWPDIEDLCAARDLLSQALGLTIIEGTNRYTVSL